MKPYKVKKQKKLWMRKEFLWTAFIILIMVSSVMGFLWGGSPSEMKYKGVSFEMNEDGLWEAKIDGNQMLFMYHPLQVEDINITGNAVQRIKGAAEIDITSSENDSNKDYIALAEFQMLSALMEKHNKFIRTGYDAENKVKASIIKCEDSTDYVPVVYFRTSNMTQVYEEGRCIIVEGSSGFEFLRAWERIYYSFLGVMG